MWRLVATGTAGIASRRRGAYIHTHRTSNRRIARHDGVYVCMYVCMHAAGQRGEGGTGGRSSMPPVHGPSRRLNGRRLVVIGAPSTHLAHPARRSSPTTSRHQSSVSVPCRGHIVSSSPYATGALLSSVLSLHRPSPPASRLPPSVSVPCWGYIVSSSPYATGTLLSSCSYLCLCAQYASPIASRHL
jgi:hypothetical protein